MPKYDFHCNSCGGKQLDIFIPAEKVKGNHWKPVCSKCNTSMEVIFTVPAVHWKGGEPPPSVAIKRGHEVDKQMEIYNEGFTSQSELKESMDMAKEEEKKREKPEGLLTTGVKESTTKEEREKVIKRAANKVKESRAARGQKRCR